MSFDRITRKFVADFSTTVLRNLISSYAINLVLKVIKRWRDHGIGNRIQGFKHQLLVLFKL